MLPQCTETRSRKSTDFERSMYTSGGDLLGLGLLLSVAWYYDDVLYETRATWL